jgi:5-methylcytosine-specific restriction protein A
MNRWWLQGADERFWLEATDRTDLGSDLRAPATDDSGRDNWRYSLFKHARVGDVVLHYDKRPASNGVVGWSRVSGPWRSQPIVWAARGSYARDKGTQPHERPGFLVPLADFHRLPAAVTLDRIRAVEPQLRALVAEANAQYGEPLYFPFELSDKRPIRLLQGYAFKLPRRFVELFPELRAPLAQPSAVAEVSGETSHRNPAWSRDELILALELYLRHRASPPGKASFEVHELSDLLNKLDRKLGREATDTFRNPNGVYMKMMNFRRFDAEYTSAGKVGLTRGNKDDEAVWLEFSGDRERLARVADAIRQATLLPVDEEDPLANDDNDVEAPEGRLLTRLHRTRERSRKLVEQRKLKALREFGHLRCEVCQFNFEERYGARGKGFIEAHHIKPVESLVEGSKTKLEDLALLCANCHRMVHSTRPWLGLDELRNVLRRD